MSNGNAQRAGRVHRHPEWRSARAHRDYQTDRRRASAVAEHHLGPVESVRFVYLQTGEELVWAPEREDVPFIAESVAADIDGIWNQVAYEPSPGAHCDWCPFADRCPATDPLRLEQVPRAQDLPF